MFVMFMMMMSWMLLKNLEKMRTTPCMMIFPYLGLVLRDPCGLGNPFLPQKTGEDI